MRESARKENQRLHLSKSGKRDASLSNFCRFFLSIVRFLLIFSRFLAWFAQKETPLFLSVSAKTSLY
jgi:hypothetical protein